MYRRKGLTRIAVSICFFNSGLFFATWASRIPSVKDAFHYNEAELGAVLFSLPLGALIALPFAGWIVHKFGSKLITTISLISYSLLLYFISIVDTTTLLSLTLFLFGFIGNLLNIAMNTQAISVQQTETKPILSGFHGMWSVGAFSAALIGGWTMKENFTTIEHLSLIGGFGLVMSILLSFYLIADQAVEHQTKIIVLPNKGLLVLGFICFCAAMCEGAMADWSSLYYRNLLVGLQKVSTAGYISFAFCMAVGRFMGDRLVQHFGYKKVLQLNGFFVFIGMGLALFISQPVAVIIGFSFVGLGVSSVFPIVYFLAAKSKTMAPSAALAAVSSVGFTGFLLGPPCIGFIAHQIGLRLALIVVCLLGFTMWLLSRYVKVSTD